MFGLLRSQARRVRSLNRTHRRKAFLESLERRELLTTIAWSAGPTLPAPRTDAVAVVTPDNAIRLVGGDSAAATDAPVLANGATSWSLGVNIDMQRNDLGAVSTGSSVYLFGGTGNDEGSDEVLNYDFGFGDSQDLAKMSQIRYDHGFAADAAGRAYALGGIGVNADGEIWSDAERYDPAGDAWTPIASLPQALYGLAAIGDGNGHIFVFGGSTTLDESGIQRTAYSYDIAADSWTTVAPLPTGTRDSAVTMDSDGNVYVIGGMTTSGPTDAVQQYDPSTNTWTSQTALPAATYSLAATYGPGGKIVVAGGFDAAGNPTNAVYVTQDLTISDIAPVIATSPNTSASLDTFYTYDVNATGNPVPTYSLVTAPAGMTIDEGTGVVAWTPSGQQGGPQAVTVRGTNAGGTTDLTFNINALFTGAVTGVTVSGSSLLVPELSWTAPTGEGADLVDSYTILGSATWGVGRTKQTHHVNYTVPATETSVVMTGMRSSDKRLHNDHSDLRSNEQRWNCHGRRADARLLLGYGPPCFGPA